MKSKAENNQTVKTGTTPPVSSSASSICPKNTPPGNTGVTTPGSNSDQISSGAPLSTTPNQIKQSMTPTNDSSDNNSNSDNHTGGGGIGGTLTAPHSVGSSISGGDRGTPIGTPGIGHPPRYVILNCNYFERLQMFLTMIVFTY